MNWNCKFLEIMSYPRLIVDIKPMSQQLNVPNVGSSYSLFPLFMDIVAFMLPGRRCRVDACLFTNYTLSWSTMIESISTLHLSVRLNLVSNQD